MNDYEFKKIKKHLNTLTIVEKSGDYSTLGKGRKYGPLVDYEDIMPKWLYDSIPD